MIREREREERKKEAGGKEWEREIDKRGSERKMMMLKTLRESVEERMVDASSERARKRLMLEKKKLEIKQMCERKKRQEMICFILFLKHMLLFKLAEENYQIRKRKHYTITPFISLQCKIKYNNLQIFINSCRRK